jgi:hypothetical protein
MINQEIVDALKGSVVLDADLVWWGESFYNVVGRDGKTYDSQVLSLTVVSPTGEKIDMQFQIAIQAQMVKLPESDKINPLNNKRKFSFI